MSSTRNVIFILIIALKIHLISKMQNYFNWLMQLQLGVPGICWVPR